MPVADESAESPNPVAPLTLNAMLPAGWRPPNVESLPAWRILRGVRSRRGLSQRRLAEVAGLPVSTISRIETGRARPRYETMLHLLGCCGYAIVVADAGRQFEPLTEDRFDDHLYDDAGRHPPPHLPLWLIKSHYEDPWWGWGRLAWDIKERAVPSYTFEGRPRRDWGAYTRWRDAT